MFINKYILPLLSPILILLTAVFFIGIVNSVRSFLSGRKGPGMFQMLKDTKRLFTKGAVYAPITGPIFQLAPSIYFSSIIMALLVIPFSNNEAILGFEGDFIFFAYTLAIGKFFMILGALDTGSSFQGMGANREALYSLLVEPAFFILMGSFSMMSGHTSFHAIYQELHKGFSYESYLLCIVAAFILVQIALVETGRLPIDDSKTHLELTMIHEVMILDHSGVDLALIQLGTSLKFAIYGAIVANMFISPSIHLGLQCAAFLGIQLFWAITLAYLESFRARARMKRNPLIIFSLTAMSILVFFGVLLIMNKFSI